MKKIKFNDSKFFDVIKPFEYTGPLSKHKRENLWSNIAYHSIKVKFPKDFDLSEITTKKLTEIIYINEDKWWSCKFTIVATRQISIEPNSKSYKLEVSDLEKTPVTKQKEREIKLSEFFDL